MIPIIAFGILPLCIGVGLFGWLTWDAWFADGYRERQRQKENDAHPQASLAKLIISLLEDDSWTYKSGMLAHPTGVGLVTYGGRVSNVELAGKTVDVGSYWRIQISDKVKEMADKKQDEISSHLEEQFANNVIDFVRRKQGLG